MCGLHWYVCRGGQLDSLLSCNVLPFTHETKHTAANNSLRRPAPTPGLLPAACRAVNRLAVSQNGAFFVSASSDETVKVWDCRRLEKDVSFRSRLTYTGQGE